MRRGNNPEPFEVAFHHVGPTFIIAHIVNLLQTWLVGTKDNMKLIDLSWPKGIALSECFT